MVIEALAVVEVVVVEAAAVDVVGSFGRKNNLQK